MIGFGYLVGFGIWKHLIGLEIWLGLRFGWVGHLVRLGLDWLSLAEDLSGLVLG